MLIALYLCSSTSFTSSVRVSAYTRAQSLTSSLIWRTWASTAQRITILLISVSQATPSLEVCVCVVFFVFTSLSSLSSVIEVASGEYGDLNPVLFEAVQGGLCSEESKKNSRDKSDSSCPSQCYSVSDTSPLTIAPHLLFRSCTAFTVGLRWMVQSFVCGVFATSSICRPTFDAQLRSLTGAAPVCACIPLCLSAAHSFQCW